MSFCPATPHLWPSPPVRLIPADSRPNRSPRGRIGAPPPHLPAACAGNQSAEQKEAPHSPPPVAPASTPLSALPPPPVAPTPVRLIPTDSRPNRSPRGRIGAPPPHLPVAHPGNQSAEQKEAPHSPPPAAPASTPLSASPLVSHTCSLCSQAKKALERAVGVLLQTWTNRGDLSRAPDGAEQGLGWDVASLRKLVFADSAVAAAWRVFSPTSEPQPNDIFSKIVKTRVNSTLGVEQVHAYKVGANKGPLLGHLASCTSNTAKVWPNVVVRCPSLSQSLPSPSRTALPYIHAPALLASRRFRVR